LNSVTHTSEVSNVSLMRFLLLLEVVTYGGWWFVIHLNNPLDYNPVWSRLLVVVPPFLICLASFRVKWIARHLEQLFYVSLYVLVAHNFYAKHMNYDNPSWIMATYITVAAIGACFQSQRALVFHSIYTFLLGFYISYLNNHPYEFYIAGLVTILVVMNITLFIRNRALSQLAEAKKRFEKLFDSVSEGVALHEGGKIIAVNNSFSVLFNQPVNELLGSDILSLVAPKSIDLVMSRIQENFDQPFEVWAQRKDGTSIPVEILVKPHFYEKREVRMVTVRNMQERYQFEAERQKKLEAQAAVELRDQFISIASHELRTPLTPLKLTHEILIRMIKSQGSIALSDSRVLKMLETSNTQVHRITKLIEDMLDVSRMKIGHFEMNLESFDLCEVLEQIVALYTLDSSQGTPIKVLMRRPVMVTADRLRIEQVITNLLKNAMVYGEQRPIKVMVSDRGGKALLVVKDNGIGIPQGKITQIFERFERAVSAKSYGGLGLGLFIVKQIVKAHGGDVTARSKLGRGARFTVVLPKKFSGSSVMFKPEVRPYELELY
jgi:PAS domain S-box-containing protein